MKNPGSKPKPGLTLGLPVGSIFQSIKLLLAMDLPAQLGLDGDWCRFPSATECNWDWTGGGRRSPGAAAIGHG